jgi:hypothetical protein
MQRGEGWRNCVSAADPLTFIIAGSDLRGLICKDFCCAVI